MKAQLLLLAAGLSSGLAQATITETHSSGAISKQPPDGSAAGAVSVLNISSSIISLTDVNVTFTLASPGQGLAYNGDFYAYLEHDTGFSVLLNRVGRRIDLDDPSALYGYADNGMSVTLDDQAALGDIHLYRETLDSHLTPIDITFNLPLTGIWQPDGRNVDSLAVLDTDPRTTLLNIFNGLNGSGEWRLFVADRNDQAAATLTGWSLELTGEPISEVPEGEVPVVVLGALAMGYRFYRRPR